MFHLDISVLALDIANSAGHEHRVQPIALRASAILGARLGERYRAASGASRTVNVGAVTAPALNLDLGHTGDEEAAQQIAGAWFDALALHLKA